jgi:hypothetical protein
MTDIKSIPSMSKAELVKEVERLVALVRSQSAAMTELGKLSDMQQERIAELTQALASARTFSTKQTRYAAERILKRTEPRP